MALSLVYFCILFLVYVLLIGICIYYCNFADPNTSTVAHVLHVTGPQYISSTLQKICPPFLLDILHLLFVQNVMVLVYLAITLGCWSIIFFYVYPWMTRQHQHLTSTTTSASAADFDSTAAIFLPLHHQYIGIVVFAICMLSYRIGTQSSPGIISSANAVPFYNHYPYDNYMYEPPSNTSASDSSRNRQLLKLARSKFDRIKYHHYIPRYDHYCIWMNNTFGEENYRYFLLFLLIHVAMCVYGSVILGILFYNDIYVIHQLHLRTFVDIFTKAEVPVTTFILFNYIVSSYTYEVAVLAVLIVMSITLLLFLGYHIYMITFTGLTSNEMYKWSQIQKWYKSEIKLYKRQEKMKMSNQTTEATVEHPGPKPINIYNYGVVQNWKHVLYPVSIQKRRRRQQQLLRQEPRQPQQLPSDQSTKQS